MTPCPGPCAYGVGEITWHAGTADGDVISVVRPDRGDAAPTDVYRSGVLVPTVWRHVAVGGHCWSADPCACSHITPERQPVRRGHLAAVS